MNGNRGYACVGLFSPKNPVNVGAALRAAGVYGASLVAMSGKRFPVSFATDTMKAYRHMPFLRVESLHEIVPYDCVPVAVDLVDGARPLTSYIHPERAFYIFGPEDGTLGRAVTEWCRDTVYVPTTGCMNLAATVNVVLYDRMQKSNNSTPPRTHSKE